MNSQYIIRFIDHVIVDGHVEYVIEITDTETSETWNIRERYRNVRDMHLKLCKEAIDSEVPEFPPKKVIGNKDELFLKQRQNEMEDYFSVLTSRKDLIQLDSFQHFVNSKRIVRR
mmetsp:Transcript_25374/g.29027  ORF Transcript_25374/g.29027 Transcript_25374/m.29027 type:complete len:115 (-) Transcript_25374:601-945(-)